MARCIGAQGQVKPAKNAKNTRLWRQTQTTPNANWIFLKIETTRLPESVEGLNSSPALATGELWPKMCQPS